MSNNSLEEKKKKLVQDIESQRKKQEMRER